MNVNSIVNLVNYNCELYHDLYCKFNVEFITNKLFRMLDEKKKSY